MARYDTEREPRVYLEDGGPFDIVVGTKDTDYGPMRYAVYLPHQCDEWGITFHKYSGWRGVKVDALATVKRFRAELDEAIRLLEELE